MPTRSSGGSLITSKNAEKGVYLYRFRLSEDRRVTVGRLGVLFFPAGHYIYTGSALGGLRARLERHCRLGKGDSPRWHVDYLSVLAREKEFVVVRTMERLECALNSVVCEMPGACSAADGFGCSDCRCRTHLHRVSGPLWPDSPGLKPWRPDYMTG